MCIRQGLDGANQRPPGRLPAIDERASGFRGASDDGAGVSVQRSVR